MAVDSVLGRALVAVGLLGRVRRGGLVEGTVDVVGSVTVVEAFVVAGVVVEIVDFK